MFQYLQLLFFTIQNVNMYPYQYTWFNLFGNFVDINKKLRSRLLGCEWERPSKRN